VTPRAELVPFYEAGTGTFRARAIYESEGAEVIITALPYQVSGSKVFGADCRADPGEEAADGGEHP
jgi:DNA gyrase/topoisomerase IV subunit A